MCNKAEKLYMLVSYREGLDTLSRSRHGRMLLYLKFASSLKKQIVQRWENSTLFIVLLIKTLTLMQV